jgi:hypothetical protein
MGFRTFVFVVYPCNLLYHLEPKLVLIKDVLLCATLVLCIKSHQLSRAIENNPRATEQDPRAMVLNRRATIL